MNVCSVGLHLAECMLPGPTFTCDFLNFSRGFTLAPADQLVGKGVLHSPMQAIFSPQLVRDPKCAGFGLRLGGLAI